MNEADPCNCWIERDGSWNVVPFNGSTNGPPEYRNDDGSTAPFAIPFNFVFMGVITIRYILIIMVVFLLTVHLLLS